MEPWLSLAKDLGSIAIIWYLVCYAYPQERTAARQDYLIAAEKQRGDYLKSLSAITESFERTHARDQDLRHEQANKIGELTLAVYSALPPHASKKDRT